jgi:predicted DNA-binding transcriptional regulator AlpA
VTTLSLPRRPISYPPETVLTIDEVAAWLGISKRQVERLDIPFSLLGKRTKRYVAAEVLAFLESRKVAA